jgi:hypothetical protein
LISKGNKKKMQVFIQNPDRILTESRLDLVIKLEMLATIFRVVFVVLPGVAVLPHFERHLPQFPD